MEKLLGQVVKPLQQTQQLSLFFVVWISWNTFVFSLILPWLELKSPVEKGQTDHDVVLS